VLCKAVLFVVGRVAVEEALPLLRTGRLGSHEGKGTART
jgi:hypothetical protein